MSRQDEVFTNCRDVRAALVSLSLAIEMNEDVWTMRKGLGRLLTQNPKVLSPLAEPRKNEQVALDALVRELGGTVGDSRFGKNYRRFLEYRWRSRRVSASAANAAMEAE